MSPFPFSLSELLKRLGPTLAGILSSHGITREEARPLLEKACMSLLTKRSAWTDPEGWLLRNVEERCREITGEDDQ